MWCGLLDQDPKKRLPRTPHYEIETLEELLALGIASALLSPLESPSLVPYPRRIAARDPVRPDNRHRFFPDLARPAQPSLHSSPEIYNFDPYHRLQPPTSAMANEGETQSVGHSDQPHPIARSDSSTSTSPSDHNEPIIHQRIPQRPPLPTRKSSGPLVVPRDSSAVGPIEPNFGPDDVRAVSPRRTSEELDKIGKEAREEMRR